MSDVDLIQPPLWRRFMNFPLTAMAIALIVVIFCFALGALAATTLLPPLFGLSDEIRFDLVSIPLLIIAYEVLIRRLGEQPRDDFRDPKAFRHLGLGLACGFLLFSLAVGVAVLLGVYRIIGPGDPSGLLAVLIGPTLFAAVSEELIFRGILFRWIEEFGGSWAALIISSALFGLAHSQNPGATWLSTGAVAVDGMMLGAAYMLTRSLWLPMGIHAGWNFVQGELYDVPVSGRMVHGLIAARLSGPPLLTGGDFGLEASVITIFIATAFGVWLLWLAVRRAAVMQPWWKRRPVLLIRAF